MWAKVVTAGGTLKSFELAAQMLRDLAELPISGRQVGRLTHAVGAELQTTRDDQTEQWVHYRVPPSPQPAPALAAVVIDGGRIQTRQAGRGPGVHQQSWRETKVGCCLALEGPTFAADPQPEPPACFLDHRYVADLVRELKAKNGLAGVEIEPPAGAAAAALEPPAEPAWPPKRLVRTCVATQRGSEAFGPMVAAEAHARRFNDAPRRAFVADGQQYNWSIQRRWFKGYEPITDFIHPLAYLYLAAAASSADLPARWERYVRWMIACWQGRVGDVLVELTAWQREQEPGADPLGATDPRAVVQTALTYLSNNQARMDYPRYRRAGLPITSSAVESLLKEFNYRVKGTEKFWNEPAQTETILQVRAALLSGDGRFAGHLAARPGNPFHRPPKAAAA